MENLSASSARPNGGKRRRLLRIGLSCVGMILASVFLGFVLLLSLEWIPTEPLVRHLRESVPTMKRDMEGNHPFPYWLPMRYLATETEGLILEHAAYDGNEPAVEKILLRYYYRAVRAGEELGACESLLTIYAGEEKNPDIEIERTEYERYWHGYMLYVRPLLYFFNYGQIRVFNLILQTLLAAWIVFLLWKNRLKAAVVPYLLTWGILIPPVTAMNFQYSNLYYVYSIGSVILLSRFRKWIGTDKPLYFFLFLGIATSYVDLLSYPVVTLGVPLAFFFLLKYAFLSDQERGGVRENLLEIVYFSALWFIGYTLMWASKWALAAWLTDYDAFSDAFRQILYRLSRADKDQNSISVIMMYVRVLGAFVINPVTIAALAYALRRLVLLLRAKAFSRERGIVFGAIALVPFLWYLMAANHSYFHFNFAARALVASALGVMYMLIDPKAEAVLQTAEERKEIQ